MGSLALALLAAAAAACASRAETVSAPPASQPSQAPKIIQPGAPGQESREVGAVPTKSSSYNDADVRFMQGMIGHHSQAIEMVDLLKTRTKRDDMKLLALRIEVSQRDEIKFMQDWLRERKLAVPDEHAHHAHDYTLMPGMLPPAEMAKLRDASGEAFDRLFLEFMIRHHDGALLMVDELFKAGGGNLDPMVNAFASDVVADQKMEMDRMAGMLRGMKK